MQLCGGLRIYCMSVVLDCISFSYVYLINSTLSALYITVYVVCCAFATELLIRRFSSAPPSTEVTYEQLKRLLASGKAVVVDVREPWELREYGFIPGSINVPRECCSS